MCFFAAGAICATFPCKIEQMSWIFCCLWILEKIYWKELPGKKILTFFISVWFTSQPTFHWLGKCQITLGQLFPTCTFFAEKYFPELEINFAFLHRVVKAPTKSTQSCRILFNLLPDFTQISSVSPDLVIIPQLEIKLFFLHYAFRHKACT